MATLSFENWRGNMRVVAKLDGYRSDKEIISAAKAEIRKFCKNYNFTVYYMRFWNVDEDNVTMTKIDVGSHTEFFYLNPAVSIESASKKS